MKTVLLIAGALLLAAASATAQWVQPIEIYLGGGIDTPKDPGWFDSNFKGRFHFMFGAGIRSFPFMEVVGKYERHRVASDIPDETGGEITAHLLGVDGKFNWEIPAVPVEPYALVGGGLSWLRQAAWNNARRGLTVAGQTDLFYELGGGAQAMVRDNFGLFAQARWVNIILSPPNQGLGNSLRLYSITVGFKWVEGT